ncbi:hypothetical protein E2C01_078744 [Portunus trituberculatus]|uniref:Uncharacterized protein n=1 Tax=Portunus trituberculatus TaxID=210409 RepID=A0A5B7IHN6_PORTR|nr:hypothetical protein [Portunus trituberculatus]
MVRGRIEDPLERATLPHQVSVDEELHEEVEVPVDADGGQRHTEERHGMIETQGTKTLEHGLPQRHRHIVVLVRMVNLVPRPDDTHFCRGGVVMRC